MSKIKEEIFGLEIGFIGAEDLVTIKVIKRKHLEQVQEEESFPENGGRIIGTAGVWLVYEISTYHPDGPIRHLRKIRDMDFVTQAVERRLLGVTQEEYRAKVELVREEAWSFLVERCRQLFTE